MTEPTQAPPPAPERLFLAEAYPACFDWEHPRPLKIGVHKDLVDAGHPKKLVKRALAAYCTRFRYRKALRVGAVRVDLNGQPAGAVTEEGIERSRTATAPGHGKAAKPELPPDATPIPEENLVPGKLELTAKFSELPKPLPVQGGMKIGIQTGEGIVVAILPPKAWKKLEKAATDWPGWVCALTGKMGKAEGGTVTLESPALQVFEKKAKPEAAPEATGPTPPDAKTPPAPTTAPPYPKLSLKGRK